MLQIDVMFTKNELRFLIVDFSRDIRAAFDRT